MRTDAMSVEIELLRGATRGYLAGVGPLVTEEEVRALPVAGLVMAFENAIRFLTDYLLGDGFFRPRRKTQNLDRFHAQLRLAELLDEQRPTIETFLAEARAESVSSPNALKEP